MLVRLGESIGKVSDKKSWSLLFSLGTTALFGLFEFSVDLFLESGGVSRDTRAAIQACIVGIGTGIVSYLLLAARRERRNMVRAELSRVAELNHHLRNSLQIIVSANYIAKDEEHARMMLKTVQTMDQVLKRLFPAAGIERRTVQRGPMPASDPLRKMG